MEKLTALDGVEGSNLTELKRESFVNPALSSPGSKQHSKENRILCLLARYVRGY